MSAVPSITMEDIQMARFNEEVIPKDPKERLIKIKISSIRTHSLMSDAFCWKSYKLKTKDTFWLWINHNQHSYFGMISDPVQVDTAYLFYQACQANTTMTLKYLIEDTSKNVSYRKIQQCDLPIDTLAESKLEGDIC